jgi:putative acetyltransferase
MEIRLFRAEDSNQIAQLFHDTVREVNICDYSSRQVKAWAPDNLHFINWESRGSAGFTYVADDGGVIAGFGLLEPNDHIDCFYCHKNYQRRGVGSQIYQAIETQAVALSISRLFTEASITAKPFFQRMGFAVVKTQEVTCRGETFLNYVMEKQISFRIEFRILGAS